MCRLDHRARERARGTEVADGEVRARRGDRQVDGTASGAQCLAALVEGDPSRTQCIRDAGRPRRRTRPQRPMEQATAAASGRCCGCRRGRWRRRSRRCRGPRRRRATLRKRFMSRASDRGATALADPAADPIGDHGDHPVGHRRRSVVEPGLEEASMSVCSVMPRSLRPSRRGTRHRARRAWRDGRDGVGIGPSRQGCRAARRSRTGRSRRSGAGRGRRARRA